MTDQLLKISFGSGPRKPQGFLGVDGLDWDGATDVLHDLNFTPYPFDDRSASEIVAIETLEHLSWGSGARFLAECYRILDFSGSLYLQVPDIGKMAVYFCKNEICDCVPRKTAKMEDYRANPKCQKCHGRAKIHPDRWFTAFSGAGKHEFDYHLSHFTLERMQEALIRAGFSDITFKDDLYKIKVKAKKAKI